MTLRFYLLRHAKAEAHSFNKDDKDRQLSAHGRQQAQQLGGHLANQGVVFDHIWCSDAARTKETLTLLQEAYPAHGIVAAAAPAAIHFVPALYHAPAPVMLQLLRQTPADATTLLMVGHNPGISELANHLAVRGEESLINSVHLDYPTCGLCIFDFHCASWAETGPSNSEILARL